MIGKIECKEDGSGKVKKSFVALIQKWLGKVQMRTTLLDKVCLVRAQKRQVRLNYTLGVKAEPKGKERMRLAEITKQLDLARFRISQYQDSLSAIGRSKQEYEYLYEEALKAMNVAWQNYGSLHLPKKAKIDTFESAVTSLLTIQNELEQYLAHSDVDKMGLVNEKARSNG